MRKVTFEGERVYLAGRLFLFRRDYCFYGDLDSSYDPGQKNGGSPDGKALSKG